MIRSELVEAILADNPNLSVALAERLVATFFETITARVAQGGRVEIRGFGSFEIRNRVARPGRNPRTGEVVMVEAKSVPHFKPGKRLRERIAKATD